MKLSLTLAAASKAQWVQAAKFQDDPKSKMAEITGYTLGAPKQKSPLTSSRQPRQDSFFACSIPQSAEIPAVSKHELGYNNNTNHIVNIHISDAGFSQIHGIVKSTGDSSGALTAVSIFSLDIDANGNKAVAPSLWLGADDNGSYKETITQTGRFSPGVYTNKARTALHGNFLDVQYSAIYIDVSDTRDWQVYRYTQTGV